MATVGEVKAQLSHAVTKAGEGYASLDTAREAIGAAIESFREAAEAAGVASDGTEHDTINSAVVRYISAENSARSMIGSLEDAQNTAMAGNNLAEEYMGMLG